MATILVADDERDTVELLKFMLERDGHCVIDVYDGQAAYDHAVRDEIDLIVLDVMMPKIDGYSLATALSEKANTRAVPVIIITAKIRTKDLFEVLPNVVGYIEKPFEPALVREKVNAVLSKTKR